MLCRHALIYLVQLLRILEHAHFVFDFGLHGLFAFHNQSWWHFVVRAQTLELHDHLAVLAQALEDPHHSRHCQHLVPKHVLPLFLVFKLLSFIGEDFLSLFGLRSGCGAIFSTLLEDIIEHLDNLLGHERHRPREDVHEVRQNVRMGCVVELLYVEGVVLEFDDCSLVVVDVAIVGRREDCDDNGELLGAVPLVHFVAVKLRLVSSKHR